MSAFGRQFVLAFCFLYIIRLTSAFGFDVFIADNDQCGDICTNTFQPHTYDKVSHHDSCQRGCRLYNIISFVDTCDNMNHTRLSCVAACKDAYSEDTGSFDACSVGCASHKPRQPPLQQYEPEPIGLYPFLYVHGVYSNMIEKLRVPDQLFTSWSLFMKGADSRELVIMRAQPVFIQEEVDEPLADEHTLSEIESNLAAVDQSRLAYETNGGPSDWLGCLANKTGIPRLLLSVTILLSAVAMIWLCLTTAVTAPEQRVTVGAEKQKLSIYGDGDVVWKHGDADDDDLLAAVHVSEGTKLVDTAALPVKTRII